MFCCKNAWRAIRANRIKTREVLTKKNENHEICTSCKNKKKNRSPSKICQVEWQSEEHLPEKDWNFRGNCSSQRNVAAPRSLSTRVYPTKYQKTFLKITLEKKRRRRKKRTAKNWTKNQKEQNFHISRQKLKTDIQEMTGSDHRNDQPTLQDLNRWREKDRWVRFKDRWVQRENYVLRKDPKRRKRG